MTPSKTRPLFRLMRPAAPIGAVALLVAGCQHYGYDPYGPYDPYYYGPSTPTGVIYTVPGRTYTRPRYRRRGVDRRGTRRRGTRRGGTRQGRTRTTRRTEPIHTKARTRSYREYRDRH